MKRDTFIRECSMGGPGHDGYAYNADTYCVPCGDAIIEKIAPEVAPTLTGTDDPLFQDSEVCPQPIFFGEHPDTSIHCAECDEYLYGEDSEED